MPDIGLLGEDQFQIWCTQVDLTAVRIPQERDKNGFDFIVQFPQLDSSRKTDKRWPQPFCKVQVKSTAVGEKRAAIKLDNWERMIREPTAWFVVAISFNGVNPQDVFVIHIDQTWTHKVLKQLRKLEKSNPLITDQMHEHEIYITWNSAHRLPSTNATELREKLLSFMGADRTAYAINKDNWYQQVGYDNNPKKITLAIKAKNQNELYSTLCNYALGLLKKMPFDLLTLTDTRFGIPKEEVNLTNATEEEKLGHLGPVESDPEANTLIMFSDANRSTVVTVKCRTFCSQWIFPKLPKKYWKLRFAAPSVSLIMDAPGSKRKPAPNRPISVSTQLCFPIVDNPEKSIQLDYFYAFGRIVKMLLSAKHNGFKISSQHGEQWGGLPVYYGPANLSDETIRLARVADNIGFVGNSFGLDSNIEITPQEIASYGQRLHYMRIGLSGVNSITIAMPKESHLTGQNVAILTGVSLPVGGMRLTVCYAICGDCVALVEHSRRSPRNTIKDRKISVLWKQIMPSKDWSLDDFDSKIQRTNEELQRTGISAVRSPSREELELLCR